VVEPELLMVMLQEQMEIQVGIIIVPELTEAVTVIPAVEIVVQEELQALMEEVAEIALLHMEDHPVQAADHLTAEAADQAQVAEVITVDLLHPVAEVVATADHLHREEAQAPLVDLQAVDRAQVEVVAADLQAADHLLQEVQEVTNYLPDFNSGIRHFFNFFN